jgi:DNA repair protein RecO (recombination protein O)
LMRALLAGDWDTVSRAEDQTKEAVGNVVSTYLQWQLERGLRSLRFLERSE